MIQPSRRLMSALTGQLCTASARARGVVLTAAPSISVAAAAIRPHIHRFTASASHPHLPRPPATPAGVAGNKRTSGSP
ncbi:MAG: hypothetical protein OXP69_13840, partial [Spirochaetaceae bacterium]|nr:hypothetical protein [Spirochaetaceae bacterium]